MFFNKRKGGMFLTKKNKSKRLLVAGNLILLVVLAFAVRSYYVTAYADNQSDNRIMNLIGGDNSILTSLELWTDAWMEAPVESTTDTWTETPVESTTDTWTETPIESSSDTLIVTTYESNADTGTEANLEAPLDTASSASSEYVKDDATAAIPEHCINEETELATEGYDEALTEQYIDATEEITSEHVHTFVISSSCTWYPEVGHYEDICVAEGYTEERYESYEKYCYKCGCVMDTYSFDELMSHSSAHGAYGTYQKLVESVYHEPVYEKIWVVDQEEYYEEEEVVECIECGYIQ